MIFADDQPVPALAYVAEVLRCVPTALVTILAVRCGPR